jgi:HSP20 family protein
MNQVTRCSRPETRTFTPRADVHETADAYVFDLDLPGVDPRTVAVEFEHGVLSVDATAAPLAVEGLVLAHEEFGDGRFRRSFRVPDDADGEAIEATAKHGVLSIRVTKQKRGARKIEVRAS